VIQDATCSALAVSREDLLSPKRTARVAHARQLAIYLSRELTSLSLAQIAREFNRDHTTIMYAIRNVTSRLEPGSETANALHRTRTLLIPPTDQPDHDAALHHRPVNSPPMPSTGQRPTPEP
jgi:chromosomal replication initiator protein